MIRRIVDEYESGDAAAAIGEAKTVQADTAPGSRPRSVLRTGSIERREKRDSEGIAVGATGSPGAHDGLGPTVSRRSAFQHTTVFEGRARVPGLPPTSEDEKGGEGR